MTTHQWARQVMRRAEVLGRISDEPGRLTRLSWSPAMRRANDQVARWMRQAGMTVREDAIGNLIGRYPCSIPKAKTFLIGSHLDTVRDAGKYDGVLGVLVGIACVQQLRNTRRDFPFHLDVIGFADEEGIHFQSAYLGSGALTGSTTRNILKRMDTAGISLADAIRKFGGDPARLGTTRRDPRDLLGYAEVHIEQGPVLETKRFAVGVVAGIVGITRAQLTFQGRAGHAGTTPMALRHDALCAAAEFVLAAEALARREMRLVATVGEIAARPGAVNVIPARATLSLDVRHPDDARRKAACELLLKQARTIAARRGVKVEWQPRAETRAIPCSQSLTNRLKEAAAKHQLSVPEMLSGAGHDAAEIASITSVTMLFVRCKGGISHDPSESVRTDDVTTAITVMSEFLESLAATHRRFPNQARRTRLLSPRLVPHPHR